MSFVLKIRDCPLPTSLLLVIRYCCDPHLGGQDFTNKLVQRVMEKFQKEHEVDVSGNRATILRLHEECDKLKYALSFKSTGKIMIPYLFKELSHEESVSRKEFEHICNDLFIRLMELVEKCLKEDESTITVHQVLLVGGSTVIPRVRCLLEERFGKNKLNTSVNADEAIAHGAAIHAASLSNKYSHLPKTTLIDVLPSSLGIMVNDGEMSVILKKNRVIPTKATRGNYSNDEDDQTHVDILVCIIFFSSILLEH